MLTCAELVAKVCVGEPYLVGSARFLRKRPRDVDVRFRLDDALFTEAFGFGAEQWSAGERLTFPRSERWHHYTRVCANYAEFVAHACGERNIDLQIVPSSLFDVWFPEHDREPLLRATSDGGASLV